MRAALLAFALSLAFLPGPGAAQERVTLGVGRLFTNDYFGDGNDRWRTGASVLSWMRATDGTVRLPEAAGELMEYRFSNRILAPANLAAPAPGDRRYAGILSLGAYTHFTTRGWDMALGSEFVAAGPMTGVAGFHAAAHTLLGMTPPSAAVRAAQIPNAVYPTLAFEAARPVALGGGAVLRPFVQGRLGDETYGRAGVDVLFGSAFTSGVLVRDETTGLLYQTVKAAPEEGFSFLVGADSARLLRSAWLPAPAYTFTPFYSRLRAGVQLQTEKVGLFYGATWSGPEFTAQPSGQVLGSLQVLLRF